MPSTPIACHLVWRGRGKLPIRGGGAGGRVGRADGILVVIGKKEIAPQAESARHCTLGVPSCGGGRGRLLTRGGVEVGGRGRRAA
jgi:hypothetical protein